MRKPSLWPNDLDALWAKSPAGTQTQGETLAEHTWQVLQRLADLRQLRPNLAQDLAIPDLWQRLFWVGLLHDAGKCAPGFQARLRGDRASDVSVAWGAHRHEVISLAFVDWVAPAGHLWRDWVIAGIASHHRHEQEIKATYAVANDPDVEDVVQGIDEFVVRGLHRWWQRCALSWATALLLPTKSPSAFHLALSENEVVEQWPAAAQRIRHALSDYHRFVHQLNQRNAFAPAETMLRGLITQADHTASAHAGRIGPLALNTEQMRTRWPHIAQYENHQQQAGQQVGSALLMSPTGSGKTEAALLWAAAQHPPRLFYTLPYQASMNAMSLRLEDTLGKGRVGLAHGRALLALYRLICNEQPALNRVIAEKQARRRKNLAQLHHLPVQVFSPYQMLKAMYRLTGFENMLADFDGAAFIFDEIHAYEPERLALIIETMRYVREHHRARFFVMSATFPTLARQRLAAALGNPPLITADPALYARFCRHRLQLCAGELFEPANWQRVTQAIQQGHSVLVCCNTVQRAQQAQRLLRAQFPHVRVPLLHGRLNGRDRLSREQIVREAVGSRSQTRQAIALVATQAVEVSLDIDLDTIFTDPAPLEALLQRFGRINRRRLQAQPAPVHVFTQPDDGQHIYAPDLVHATLARLRLQDGQPVAEDQVGHWLDDIYTGTIRENWVRRYEDAQAGFARQFVQPLRPFNSDDQLAQQFYEAFDGVDVLPADSAAEYEQLLESDPLRAQELFVSIRAGQLAQIAKAHRVQRWRYPIVVDVPYESGEDGIGLDLGVLKK